VHPPSKPVTEAAAAVPWLRSGAPAAPGGGRL